MIFRSRTTNSWSNVMEQNARRRSSTSVTNLMRTSVISTAGSISLEANRAEMLQRPDADRLPSIQSTRRIEGPAVCKTWEIEGNSPTRSDRLCASAVVQMCEVRTIRKVPQPCAAGIPPPLGGGADDLIVGRNEDKRSTLAPVIPAQVGSRHPFAGQELSNKNCRTAVLNR